MPRPNSRKRPLRGIGNQREPEHSEKEMNKALKPLLIADLFCGAGGSSTGAERAVRSLGREMTLVCVNHWPVAIETHKKNHPSARHYVEDVTVADPERIVPEGYLDLLMASPECRFYSRARGGRPVHDQGRMNPWAVHRWLTSLDVRCLLVENVPEFIDWGPLLEDGRPDPKHKGEFFQSWFFALQKMGYKAEWKYVNAADHGDATTRVRFFLIARKDGKAVRWPEPSHSSSPEGSMVGARARWRAAREIIDWANSGRSLLDDPKYLKRPLSPKTLSRIAKGLEKFGGPLAPLYVRLLGLETDKTAGESKPFILNRHGDNGFTRAHDVDEPIPTATTNGAGYLVEPVAFVMGKQSSPALRGVDQPIPTLTTEGSINLVEPVATPFVMGQHSGSVPRGVERPVPTIVSVNRTMLIEPVILGQHKGVVKSSEDPLPTCATHGGISVVNPIMVKFYGTGVCHPTNEPVPTVTTKDRVGLVQPFIVQNRIRPDGDRVKPIDHPIMTVTGHGAGALVNPVLVEVNHGGEGDRSYPVDQPLKTITTNRYSTALVNPVIVQTDQTGSNGACVRDIDQPIPTLVTKANLSVVHPFLIETVIEKAEGEIDPRRLVLVDGEPHMLDIRFRMLTNLELARAMGFTDQESTYEFVGNSTEVTKQIGNAVPCNLAKALVKAVLEV